MKKAIVSMLVAVLLSSVGTFGQSVNSATAAKDFPVAYDAFIRRSMAKLPDIPAFAVVVIKDDQPIFVRAYGMANMEAGINADADTLFYIASSTKSFTALAAAMLDREGKIKLADPVSKYASGINFKNAIPEKVTVRDLLTHTSGLRNDALGFRMAYSGESKPEDMAKVFGGATTFNETAFGKYAYTNLGYNIYAVLLQNQLRTRWQDILQKEIFSPLGMKHTTAYISQAPSKKWDVAQGYLFDPMSGKIVPSPLAKIDSNMQSAGGMYTSANDVGRWLNMNMNDGKLGNKQIFPADVMRAVHTGYAKTQREGEPFIGEGEYGLGWQIGTYRNEKVIYHHGGFPGYGSHISYLPEKKIAVAVLVNEGFVGSRTGHIIATYAYDWLLGTPDVQANYDKQIDDTVKRYGEWKTGVVASTLERAKRVSQLTRPVADYAGTYRNDIFGTMEITVKGNDLAVKMGAIHCVATAFTEKETIRVELIPGQGEVIRFPAAADGSVGSLTYAGTTFTRVR